MTEPITIYKLMILALLQRSDAPLSGTQLSDFFLEKEYTNYFTVQEALHELDESAFIKKEPTHTTLSHPQARKHSPSFQISSLREFTRTLRSTLSQTVWQFRRPPLFWPITIRPPASAMPSAAS